MVNQTVVDHSSHNDVVETRQPSTADVSSGFWSGIRRNDATGHASYKIALMERLVPDLVSEALLCVHGLKIPAVSEVAPATEAEGELPEESTETLTEEADADEDGSEECLEQFEEALDPESNSDDARVMSEVVLERRVLPRHRGNANVRIVRVPQNASLTGQQRNWELHGTSLRGELAEITLRSVVCLLGEPFTPGDTVYVRLTNPRTHRTLDVPAEVVRVRFVNGDDRWKIVFELGRSLTLSELQHYAYASEQPLAISAVNDERPPSVETVSAT